MKRKRLGFLMLAFSFSFVISFNLKAQNAQFTAKTKTSGCTPLTVEFQDLSTGASSWSWDLGNGNPPASVPNPKVIYTTPGTYTVSLTVTGPSGSDTETKIAYITVYDLPVPEFSFTPPSGCSPLTVNFTDESQPGSGVIDSRAWVFGDGATGGGATIAHTYNSPATFNVTLTVKNQYGCEATKVKPAAINAKGVVPSFTSPSAFCSVPALASFTNTTIGGNANNYRWNFGDGSAPMDAFNATHNYTSPGNYTVTLTTTNPDGCVTNFSKIIKVGSDDGLDINVPDKACIGKELTLGRTVDGVVLTQQWDLGNGSSSFEDEPKVTYTAAGTYNVVLSVQIQGKSCKSIVQKQVQVIPNPVPNFTFQRTCTMDIIFTNTSTASTGWNWDFGDKEKAGAFNITHKYGSPATYTVKLEALNALGCGKTISKLVTVTQPLEASFDPKELQDCTKPSLSGCAPFDVQFINKSAPTGGFTSSWSFGDGTANSIQMNPSHRFTNIGVSQVTLTITNSLNCKSQFTLPVTVSNTKPVAKFIYDKTSVCAGENVNFEDQSTNADFWCWNFGDGSTGSGKNIGHAYSTPGVYTVTLVAKNAGCTDVFVVTNAITVRDPYVGFEVKKNCVDPYTVEFTNTSKNYDSFEWDLGDGSPPEISQVVTHTFTATGNYNVSITAVNNNTSCLVKYSQNIAIQDVKADFTVDNTTPCVGDTVEFINKSEFAANSIWMFNGTLHSTNGKLKVVYDKPGNFDVTLTAFDSDNCSNTLKRTQYIQVPDIKGDFDYAILNNNCSEMAVQFHNKSTSAQPIINWKWDFGNGDIKEGNTDEHKNPITLYQYDATQLKRSVSLELTNSNGGMCKTVRNDIVDFTNPIPDFALAKTSFCINEQIQIINKSKYFQDLYWEFSNGYSFKGLNPTVAFNTKNDFGMKLTAVDKYGCIKYKDLLAVPYIKVSQPTATFHGDNISGECPPLTTTFTHDIPPTEQIQSWFWEFGDGQSAYGQDIATCTYNKPGIFDVTLTVIDVNGCTGKSTMDDIVSIDGPYGTYTISPNTCFNDTLIFEALSNNAAIHRWDFGDGNVIDDPEKIIKHVYENANTYTTSLLLIDAKGCEVLADQQLPIQVHPLPTADFTYFDVYPFAGEPVNFEGISNTSAGFEWVAFDAIQGNESNASIVFDKPGMWPVKFTAFNEAGCSQDTIKTIYVQGDITFIPNVFTPDNNDEFNNTFQMRGLEDGQWDLMVYNRWGKIILDSNDYKNDWKPNHSLAAGVYYYVITNAHRPDKSYKGYIQLLR